MNVKFHKSKQLRNLLLSQTLKIRIIGYTRFRYILKLPRLSDACNHSSLKEQYVNVSNMSIRFIRVSAKREQNVKRKH